MDRTGRPPEIEPTPTDVSVAIRSRNVVGESPLWDASTQRLYLVDIPGQRIHIFHPTDGDHRTFDLPDWVTSLSTRAQGGLVLSTRKNFAFYDPDSGHLEILDDPEPDRIGNRFNDGKCDRQGRLWAGTMGAEDWFAATGALYRFDPDRRITRMQDEVKCSNGMGWSPDGRTMYHTESFRYAIFAFDFDPGSGEIAGRRPFVQLDPEARGFPDGLTVDREGFVWSAQPVYGRIVRYGPDGEIDRIVDLPVSRGTGCAFGGPDLETLYITSATETLTDAQIAEEPLAGSVFACTPGVRGIAETPFAG
jgi:sugar lactone lactonase YvrE